MNENQAKPDNLVETTDCLEAVNVFKGWKNFFFIIVILCLLLLQGSFWLVNTNCVKTGDDTKSGSPAAAAKDAEEIEEAAKKVTGEPNQPAEAAAQKPEQQQKSSARAFFLSLVFVVLVLPWQRFFAGVVVGAMYTPDELLSRCAAARDYHIFDTILHYLRFTGYWLLVLLLLIFSQLSSGRWAKAILRRLEVM